MRRILICTARPEDARVIGDCLPEGDLVDVVADPSACLDAASAAAPDVAFVDVRSDSGRGKARSKAPGSAALPPDAAADERKVGPDPVFCIGALAAASPLTSIIALCDSATTGLAEKAVAVGAKRFLVLPATCSEIRFAAGEVVRGELLARELDYLRHRNWRSASLDPSRTASSAMREVLRKAMRVAPTRTTVLLTGETGVGKGTLARLLHHHSNRADKPFIAVHCGAIPEHLVESELFGHERGAFTGAVRRRLGKFEVAAGGTIFLDEIGTVSHATQIRLLGVLQDRVFQRVGGEKDVPADVRVIAATNEDLERACREGGFRTDLFYRLNVFPLDIPPLRKRLKDLPQLCETILARLAPEEIGRASSVAPEVLRAFAAYPWPGNVRELENVLERALILESSDEDELSLASFPPEIAAGVAQPPSMRLDLARPLAEVRRTIADEAERRYLAETLRRTGGCIGETARAAGITPRQLHKLMCKHGLRKESYRAGTGTDGTDAP